jgi:hypothetical protein
LTSNGVIDRKNPIYRREGKEPNGAQRSCNDGYKEPTERSAEIEMCGTSTEFTYRVANSVSTT